MESQFCYYESNPQLMYCDLKADDELDNISAEMIRCNQTEMNCLVPIHFTSENGKIYRIEYDLSDMKTLKSYLEQFAINKKRFIEITEKILDGLEDCSNYMLPDSQIILETDKIYIDPATMKVSLLCIPLSNLNIPYDLRNFFIAFLESIYLDVDSECESADFQKIYEIIPTQNLTVNIMRKNIEMMENDNKDKQQDEIAKKTERIMPSASGQKTASALVDVVQESKCEYSAPVIDSSNSEKKNNLLKSIGIYSSKGEKKHKKSTGASDLMALFRKAQNNSEFDNPIVKEMQKQPSDIAARVGGKSQRTVLVLHDDPDESAFLIYRGKKIRIDAEGTALGRLGGETVQKVDIFLESIHVSSYHAVISYDFDNLYYTVTDYSSTGTRLNGARIQKNVPVRISNNDMLIFGDVSCRILLERNNIS